MGRGGEQQTLTWVRLRRVAFILLFFSILFYIIDPFRFLSALAFCLRLLHEEISSLFNVLVYGDEMGRCDVGSVVCSRAEEYMVCIYILHDEYSC